MKKILLCCSIFFSVFVANAQKSNDWDSYPDSFLDLGIGVGSNYGILGVKTVLGYKGSGLLIGIGSVEGQTTSSIGIQVAYKFFFVNIASSTVGIYRSEVGNQIDEGLVKGTSFIFGGRVNLNNTKRLFLELGLGFSSGDETDKFGNKVEMNGPAFNFGFGYRIGGYYKQ